MISLYKSIRTVEISFSTVFLICSSKSATRKLNGALGLAAFEMPANHVSSSVVEVFQLLTLHFLSNILHLENSVNYFHRKFCEYWTANISELSKKRLRHLKSHFHLCWHKAVHSCVVIGNSRLNEDLQEMYDEPPSIHNSVFMDFTNYLWNFS